MRSGHRIGTALLGVLAMAAGYAARAEGQTAWQPSTGRTQIPIWPGVAPDARPSIGREVAGTVVNNAGTPELVRGKPWIYVDSVSQPTMTIYRTPAHELCDHRVAAAGGKLAASHRHDLEVATSH